MQVRPRRDNTLQNNTIQYTRQQELIEKDAIVFTSGAGGIFKSGIPIGKIAMDPSNLKTVVSFFSDFSQLKYVFAEIVLKEEIVETEEINVDNNTENNTPIDAKLKILEDELETPISIISVGPDRKQTIYNCKHTAMGPERISTVQHFQ